MLSRIESQPQPIWDAIRKYYSKGFFMAQIEQDFGITPEFTKDLKARFERRMNTHKAKTEAQIKIMTEKFDKAENKLKSAMQTLQKELDHSKSSQVQQTQKSV